MIISQLVFLKLIDWEVIENHWIWQFIDPDIHNKPDASKIRELPGDTWKWGIYRYMILYYCWRSSRQKPQENPFSSHFLTRKLWRAPKIPEKNASKVAGKISAQSALAPPASATKFHLQKLGEGHRWTANSMDFTRGKSCWWDWKLTTAFWEFDWKKIIGKTTSSSNFSKLQDMLFHGSFKAIPWRSFFLVG